MHLLSLHLCLMALVSVAHSARICRPASISTLHSTAPTSTTTETLAPSTSTETTSTSTSSTTSSTTPAAPTPFKITISSPSPDLDGKLLEWLGEYVALAPSFPGWNTEPYYIEDGTNFLKAGDLYITWYSENSVLYTVDDNFVHGPEQKKVICNKVNAAGTLSCVVGEQQSINYFYARSNEKDTISVLMGPTPRNGPADGTVPLSLVMTPI